MINFLFENKGHQSLSEFNYQCLKTISDRLEINVKYNFSSKCDPDTDKKNSKRIVNLCQKFHTDIYVNAIAGKELYTQKDFYPIPLRYIKRLDNENN